jgi:hypothetical protein
MAKLSKIENGMRIVSRFEPCLARPARKQSDLPAAKVVSSFCIGCGGGPARRRAAQITRAKG